jgi:hypothetical protein
MSEPTVPPDLQPPDWRAAYDENGVDRSMIRACLERTPTECIEILEELLDLAEQAHRVDRSVP